MKTNELRELAADELEAKVREVRKELAGLRLKHASGGEVEKPGRIGGLRHEIARMLTVLSEKKAAKEAK